MKVAAYQAPLLSAAAGDVIDSIRLQVNRCEAEEIEILCCPEAILGGLADYAENPAASALAVDRLREVLAPLASETVTTIIGFTELTHNDKLHNSAAVFHRGRVEGVYRKLHPAIRRSVYEPGTSTPVFHVPGLTFGIVICNDSNFAEPARRMAAQGATVLFVPTNNGMPLERASRELVTEARKADIARAVENRMWVIRADVAGRTNSLMSCGPLMSCGSSAITSPNGSVVRSARSLAEDLLVAKIA